MLRVRRGSWRFPDLLWSVIIWPFVWSSILRRCYCGWIRLYMLLVGSRRWGLWDRRCNFSCLRGLKMISGWLHGFPLSWLMLTVGYFFLWGQELITRFLFSWLGLIGCLGDRILCLFAFLIDLKQLCPLYTSLWVNSEHSLKQPFSALADFLDMIREAHLDVKLNDTYLV